MKLEIFKKKKVFRKGGFHTNPDVCWEIVLYAAFAVTIISLAFGFYLFQQVNTGFANQNENAIPPSLSISKERINKVLGYFSGREGTSAQILISPAPFVDPSL